MEIMNTMISWQSEYLRKQKACEICVTVNKNKNGWGLLQKRSYPFLSLIASENIRSGILDVHRRCHLV